ncbi:MAG: class I SAM-dependent RNA methyltransferase, partial [Actinomycetales bacterium]
FWQSHKRAPELLSDVVFDFAKYQNGDHVFDLYSGVGLFAARAIAAVGSPGRVTMIEESPSAITDARRVFAEVSNVEVVQGRVEKALAKFVRADVVIADPPRTGAGAKVLQEIVRLAPRSLIYVACDPAALARDTAILLSNGFKLDAIRAFDLFPMTQHMELVARFIK